MIRHTILFKVKQNVSTIDIEKALESFRSLQTKLPGILFMTAGECHFHDEKSTKFFMDGVSHGISIDFENQVALDRFFKDPVTHPAKDLIVNLAEGGYEGIVNFDLKGK